MLAHFLFSYLAGNNLIERPKMTKFRLMLILPVLMVLVGADYPVLQDKPIDDLVKLATAAIQKGNADNLSALFFSTIDLDLQGEENFYSKSQASKLLEDFFQKNKPVKFNITHRGAKDVTAFAIGKLETETTVFRVSIFIKMLDNKAQIHQLRIESDDEGI